MKCPQLQSNPELLTAQGLSLTAENNPCVCLPVSSLPQVSLTKLQQLSPLFGRITQGQANVMMHALSIMPEHAIDALIAMVQVSWGLFVCWSVGGLSGQLGSVCVLVG
jgi:hypothetical protein